VGPDGDTWQEIELNVMPASMGPPLKVMGTVTDWPCTTETLVWDEGGVTVGGVGTATVTGTAFWATGTVSVIEVSTTLALTENVLAVEYTWLNVSVAWALALAVVVFGEDVVPSPHVTVPLKELPAGAAQLSVAVTVDPTATVPGATDRLHASPTAMFMG
jgi:hypothetical protein